MKKVYTDGWMDLGDYLVLMVCGLNCHVLLILYCYRFGVRALGSGLSSCFSFFFFFRSVVCGE